MTTTEHAQLRWRSRADNSMTLRDFVAGGKVSKRAPRWASFYDYDGLGGWQFCTNAAVPGTLALIRCGVVVSVLTREMARESRSYVEEAKNVCRRRAMGS